MEKQKAYGTPCAFLTFFQKAIDKKSFFEYNNTIEIKPMIQKSS